MTIQLGDVAGTKSNMAANEFLSEIWQQVLDGQAAAWRQLVISLAPVVYTSARRAGLDRRDAEDCAQQTWLALYRARQSVEYPERVPVWLIRVASRKAFRLARKRVREADARNQLPSPPPIALPDEVLADLESIARLRLAMDQLDTKCQQLLQAVFFNDHGASYGDIARQLGMPLNSLGPTRSRCLDKLRKIMDSTE